MNERLEPSDNWERRCEMSGLLSLNAPAMNGAPYRVAGVYELHYFDTPAVSVMKHTDMSCLIHPCQAVSRASFLIPSSIKSFFLLTEWYMPFDVAYPIVFRFLAAWV